jgi:hypothetical protein
MSEEKYPGLKGVENKYSCISCPHFEIGDETRSGVDGRCGLSGNMKHSGRDVCEMHPNYGEKLKPIGGNDMSKFYKKRDGL